MKSKANQCFTAPKMRFCSDLFCQNWHSLDKQQNFCKSRGHHSVPLPHHQSLLRDPNRFFIDSSPSLALSSCLGQASVSLGAPRMSTNLLHHTAEVLPSVSKVAGVWRSLSWCLESVMLWRGIMGFIEIW